MPRQSSSCSSWQRRCQYHKAGLIPACQAELVQCEQALAQRSALEDACAQQQKQLAQLDDAYRDAASHCAAQTEAARQDAQLPSEAGKCATGCPHTAAGRAAGRCAAAPMDDPACRRPGQSRRAKSIAAGPSSLRRSCWPWPRRCCAAACPPPSPAAFCPWPAPWPRCGLPDRWQQTTYQPRSPQHSPRQKRARKPRPRF